MWASDEGSIVLTMLTEAGSGQGEEGTAMNRVTKADVCL